MMMVTNKNHEPPRETPMLTRDEIREIGLESKGRLGLTWPQLGEAIGRSPVYAAFLVYGYGQATAEEAQGLAKALSLPDDAKTVLMKAPHRTPAQPWPPTDPFIYRLYEVVMLYGPAFKDVAHEIFGDGIMSAIDMSVDIAKVEDPPGTARMELTLNGKWLQYKKF
jgi:cyanate lyase